jgi:hypothetical protein
MSNDTISRKKNTGEPGNGGQFGTKRRDDSNVILTVDEYKAAETLVDESLDTNPELALTMMDAMKASDAASNALPATGSLLDPVNHADPRVQAGEIFDTITGSDGRSLHRARPGWEPSTPTKMRVQASRPLTDAESAALGNILDFQLDTIVGGSTSGDAEHDSPYSLVVGRALQSPHRGSNAAFKYGKVARKLNSYVEKGSDAAMFSEVEVPGLGANDLTFEVYFDSIRPIREPEMWTAEERNR